MKSIYNQGQFKWTISFRVGHLKVPPVLANDAQLSEGDIFINIHASIEDHTTKTQVWCLCSAPSTSRLIWKTWEPSQDIRLLGNVPYILLLQNNYEPSWVLERSLARNRRKVRFVLMIMDGPNDLGIGKAGVKVIMTLMKWERLKLTGTRFEVTVLI